MKTVWIRNGHTPGDGVEPDAAIDRLEELPPIVEGWLGSSPGGPADPDTGVTFGGRTG